MNMLQPIKMLASLRRLNWGRLAVIGIPYVFLILLFTIPFLVVLRLSITEMDGVHIMDLSSYADGMLTFKIKDIWKRPLTQTREAL